MVQPKGQLRDNLVDDLTARVGEPEMAALILVRQAQVVDTKNTQDGCVQIVDVDRVLNDVVRKIVGLTQRQAWLNARAANLRTVLGRHFQ